ncbi:hypothetical protein, partial [Enterobacter cloacae complex sp. 4DZ1-17B1]|uniref:hypothetical protein n=1 Tax=Enterobacter cloacae complex sp. 4DZ1-17B1 TaxID=2511991 RepID=UPI0013EC318F
MNLRSGRNLQNNQPKQGEQASVISTEGSVNQSWVQPLEPIFEGSVSDTSSERSYEIFTEHLEHLNLNNRENMAAGSSNPSATMKLLFIKYQYDNEQGAKIYKDGMDRYCVKIEDRPSEFKDLVPVSYSGDRYLDDEGTMYLVVLNPNIVDKWGLMGTKAKVDEELEEKAPIMNFPNARLRRENETTR